MGRGFLHPPILKRVNTCIVDEISIIELETNKRFIECCFELTISVFKVALLDFWRSHLTRLFLSFSTLVINPQTLLNILELQMHPKSALRIQGCGN